MPQPTTAGQARTGRYYVRIPQDNIAEINRYCKQSGMRQSHFLSNALVVGARKLAQQRLEIPIQ